MQGSIFAATALASLAVLLVTLILAGRLSRNGGAASGAGSVRVDSLADLLRGLFGEGLDSGRSGGGSIGSIGVVYGDIGTSPLYAFREAMLAAMRGDGAVTESRALAERLLQR